MINAPPNIQHGPQLSNGQKVCLPFICKGDSCSLGRNCPNAHSTTRYISQPDLVIIDNWVNRTTGASWIARPPALDSGQTGTQSRVQFQPGGTRTTNTRTQSGTGNNSPPPPTAQG
jgi:hypothetical protein